MCPLEKCSWGEATESSDFTWLKVFIHCLDPLLELEDHEKFRDQDGNVLGIEVRGERHHKKCFFLVKDVSKIFELPHLNSTILHNKQQYIRNVHFTNFIRSPLPNVQSQTNEKLMYLTYKGILKVLFSSRTGNAEAFQDWAIEKLFTIQMGEEDDRDELAGQLIGVSAKTIHEVFRKNTEKTPCIYLFKIGNATQMFPDRNYDKDDIICKYGFTDDLPRRTREHNKEIWPRWSHLFFHHRSKISQ